MTPQAPQITQDDFNTNIDTLADDNMLTTNDETVEALQANDAEKMTPDEANELSPANDTEADA